jgi:hypothetical protein
MGISSVFSGTLKIALHTEDVLFNILKLKWIYS